MSNFAELLAELNAAENATETLAKAMPEAVNPEDEVEGEGDDATIKAAAVDGGAAPAPAPAPAAAAPAAPAADGKKEEPTFGKSFALAADDGTMHEVVDATEMLKAINSRLEVTDDTLAKALGSFTTIIKAQGEMIKSLSGEIGKLNAQGRGRKTMLAVVEKPGVGDTLAKSNPEDKGMSPGEFFAKANTAFEQGKLSGKELNVISVSIRGNHALDADLIKKVVSA